MKKISVIVPVYNVESYLEYCVQSVLHQTRQDFELLLIDDGSTDGSGILCDRLARENPDRVCVLHQKNQGPLASRMAGIRQARGEVLVFLDSDDSLRPDALQQIDACFSEHNCDLVLFDAGPCPDYPTMSLVHQMEADRLYQGDSKKLLYEKLIIGQIPNSVCLKAVKRDRITETEVLNRLGSVKHGEDLLMTAHLLTVCETIVYISEDLYRYRIRPGSAVHSLNLQRTASVKAVHTALESYIEKWEMPELKRKHNARKVKGWTEILITLLKNKDALSAAEFESQLHSMAEEPYFRNACRDMDFSRLSGLRRLLAFCLLKKQYALLHLLAGACHRLR